MVGTILNDKIINSSINVDADMMKIYKKLSNNHKVKYGTYHKCIFHLHTPCSYDYYLLNEGKESQNYYKNLSNTDVYKICTDRKIFPNILPIEEIPFDKNIFADVKEFLGFLLIGNELIKHDIEMVLITDHNSICGIQKLENAIKELTKFKPFNVYPEVILGIEINCADKNHIVGIFNKKSIGLIQKINQWIDEFVLSAKEGTYLTSIEVLEIINGWNGIGYIAHIDTSDIFKEKYLSGAYKKKLFGSQKLNVIGVSNVDKRENVELKLQEYKSFCFVLDEDSHCIDTIGSKSFWIKGDKCSFLTIKNAFRDYKISMELERPKEPDRYIKGILVRGGDTGFLSGKSDTEFCLTFSNDLNCFIGGRGTGKSTVLHLIDFLLSQSYYTKERLEFICNHEEVWLLYYYKGYDYLINFYSPVKDYPDDDILNYFIDKDLNYHKAYSTDAIGDYISDIALKKYMHIYCIDNLNGSLIMNKVTKKKSVISNFYNTGYSVNELVQIAGSNKINSYIYKIMFKNKVLANANNFINKSSIKGIQSSIKNINNFFEQRSKQVTDIIDSFNISQDNILKITYKQNMFVENVIDFKNLLKINLNQKQKYYMNYNIASKNLIDYLETANQKIGTINLLNYLSNDKYDKINQSINIFDFCDELSKEMIDHDIKTLDDNNYHIFLSLIKKEIFNERNIDSLLDCLKNYITDMETFDLEFNINNKEQNSSSSGPSFKNINQLSLGQKVVAMLSFVLGYSEFSEDYSPLIIDQPEDNLDNQYIYKNLVKQLRDIKTKRQVIIATHNATIVTNAKAEQVIVMESDNFHGWIEKTGYPNETSIIKRIINYLEGGVDSFNHKNFLYENVLYNTSN